MKPSELKVSSSELELDKVEGRGGRAFLARAGNSSSRADYWRQIPKSSKQQRRSARAGRDDVADEQEPAGAGRSRQEQGGAAGGAGRKVSTVGALGAFHACLFEAVAVCWHNLRLLSFTGSSVVQA